MYIEFSWKAILSRKVILALSRKVTLFAVFPAILKNAFTDFQIKPKLANGDTFWAFLTVRETEIPFLCDSVSIVYYV